MLDLSGALSQGPSPAGNLLNGQDLLQNTHRAILYVFAPFARQFGDVALRPLEYRIDENLTDKIRQTLDIHRRESIDSSALLRNLESSVNLSEYMTTSTVPDMVLRASRLNEYFRFILIFTDNNRNAIHAGTYTGDNGNQIRWIYSGFFLEEPFNFKTFRDHRHSLNLNAHGIITHKTKLNLITRYGAHGGQTNIDTRSSENILNGEIASGLIIPTRQNQSTSINIMDPMSCFNSQGMGSRSSFMSTPTINSSLALQPGSAQFADTFERPNENVSKIISGLMTAQDHQLRQQHYNRHQHAIADDIGFGEELFENKLGNYFNIPRSSNQSLFDFDVNQNLTLGHIDKIVNHELQVIPLIKNRPEMYETADQFASNYRAQFSSLIAMVLPSMMNAIGINAIDFAYEIVRTRGTVQKQFPVFSRETTWPMQDQAQVNGMVRALQCELDEGIFRTIFETVGDFSVTVNANATGFTTVVLNLVGQGSPIDPTPFEVPSVLGGMVSPIIGSDVINNENYHKISELASLVRESNNTSSYNESDHEFAAFAQQRLQERQSGGFMSSRNPNIVRDEFELP